MAVDTEALIKANREKYERLTTTRPLSPEDIPASLPPRFERHIVISDYHHRNYTTHDWVSGETAQETAHDPVALAAVERFMQSWQPTHIHFNGDMVDFHAISRFCKSAPPEDEINNSIHAMRDILRRVRRNFPEAEMSYYLGNHEVRWQNFIESVAAPLSMIDTLTYASLMGAKEVGLKMYPYKKRIPILRGILEITHGDRVRGKSGLTAHAMLEKGISGVSGHTHRLGMVYKTTRTGTVVWCEGGCLCRTDPEYVEDPDWQQGFTVIYVDRANNRFHIDQIPIINGRIVYAGQVYQAA